MSSASLPPQHGNLHPRRPRRYRLVSLTLALAIMLLFVAMSSTPAKASSLDPAAANSAPLQQMRKLSASGATKKQARVGTLGSFTDALPAARTFMASSSDKGAEGWAQQLQGLNGEQPVFIERREEEQASSQAGGVRMQKRSQVGMARLNEQMERDEGLDYLIARKQARSAKPFMGSKGRAEQKAPAARQQRLREEQDKVEEDEEDVYDEDEDSIDEQGRDADEEPGRYSVDPATHPLP